MNGPLAGQTILVTRPARQAAGLVEPLEALGATVFLLPAMEIAPPLDPEPLDQALRNVERYDWIVATSVNGVAALAAQGDRERIRDRKLAAVGPATAAAMREAFRAPDAVPEEFTGERIADAMGEVRGLRILLARADLARRELPDRLRAMGAEVDDVVAYRIVRPSGISELPSRCPDGIAFTSSSAVRGTLDTLTDAGKEEWMQTARLACIGPLTAATVRELGYEVAVMPEVYTMEGLVEGIVAGWRTRLFAREGNPLDGATTPSPTVPPFVPQGKPSSEPEVARA